MTNVNSDMASIFSGLSVWRAFTAGRQRFKRKPVIKALCVCMTCIVLLATTSRVSQAGKIIEWGTVTNPPAGDDYIAISASFYAGYALRADGSIAAWGGIGPEVTNVPTGTGFTSISGGIGAAYALRDDGSIAAWGNDAFGAVSHTPIGTGFTAIAGGGNGGYALRADGSIAAWGENAQLRVSNTPTETGFTAIATGTATGYALRADGSIAAWGWDGFGQISAAPVDTGFTAIAASELGAYALRSNGSIYGWGYVDGMFTSGPIDVPAGNDYISIAAGASSGIALRANGSIVAWGGFSADAPTGTGFTAIASHGYTAYALLTEESNPVPEPSTIAALLSLLPIGAGIVLRRRCRAKKILAS